MKSQELLTIFLKRIGISVFLVLLLIGNNVCKRESQQKTTTQLNTNWYFSEYGEDDWYQATVPGTIHTDLRDNQLIEDPYYRDNEKELQWIENLDWNYKTTFDVSSDLLNKNHLSICFKGLDTYASIFLNDSLILEANNMFREWEVEVKKLIRSKNNTIRIIFHSPVVHDSIEAGKLAYKLPDNRAFSRKAPYQYGWDWGPRFVTSGIWRNIYLQGWNGARITDVYFQQNNIKENEASLYALFEIESAVNAQGNIKIMNQNTGESFNHEFKLVKGIKSISFDINIKEPQLWWTKELGEPYLYHLITSFEINGDLVDSETTDIGLRKLELVREKDEKGETFYFRLNGRPVFMKGANYIPQDNFLARVGKERYEQLIRNVLDANMNMLRVWGGGIYENDPFYDMCDENGILVWQDFMFACNMYPGDDGFVENVKQEAIQNIKRLRNHPCIVLWCGNNEVDEGWHNWGWQKSLGYTAEDSTEVWNNYLKIFKKLLPELVITHSPKIYYIPSSPRIGWGHNESMLEGDMHYWGVWWGKEPFEVYEEKVGRFMSEYGFQAFPPMATIYSFSMPDDLKLYSEVMLSHQKHPIGNELIETYMEREYHKPKDFESFVYVSQLVQAYGIKRALEAHRRTMPYCMGTLYWQFNDCWPVASWSSTDYYYRWKALHYFVKKAYEKIIISPFVKNDTIDIYVISDDTTNQTAKLHLEVHTFDGKILSDETIDIVIPENSSDIYFSSVLNDYIPEQYKNQCLLKTSVVNDEELIAENIYYFNYPKDLVLKRPELAIDIETNSKDYIIHISTDYLAKNIYLSVEDEDVFFSDNYFDLVPGEEKIILLKTGTPIENIDEKLKVITLDDTY